METDLFDMSEKVNSEVTFLLFLKALMNDREQEVELERENPAPPYGAGALGWQNTTIEGFLESAIAWAEASCPATESVNPWSRMAQILHAGKTYE